MTLLFVVFAVLLSQAASDGQSLATQDQTTIQRFEQTYGPSAGAEWAREHDNALIAQWNEKAQQQAFDCNHGIGSCTQPELTPPVQEVLWCTRCVGPPSDLGDCYIFTTEIDIHPNGCEKLIETDKKLFRR